MDLQENSAPSIGIFDSGVGGLSVLKALHLKRPGSPLHYVADSGHAPYGDRDAAHVIERSLRVTDHLVRHGARMVVVACNTATALAIEALRQAFPEILLVGVEPGVKPAAASSRNGRIGVMATPGTLASARFAALVDRHAPHCLVLPVACAGLAGAIERGAAASDEIDALLDGFCQRLRDAGVDTVVLGCTHYPFVADRIAQRLGPDVRLLDTADAVARQAMTLHGRPPEATTSADPERHGIRLQTTGETAVLERLARSGLGLSVSAERVTL
jgi:glutamate racemase